MIEPCVRKIAEIVYDMNLRRPPCCFAKLLDSQMNTQTMMQEPSVGNLILRPELVQKTVDFLGSSSINTKGVLGVIF